MSAHVLLAVVIVAAVCGRVFFLWVRPYGKCRAPGCREGRVAGSGAGSWGRCPRCHGNPVPRWGAAGVARMVGKHGRKFW